MNVNELIELLEILSKKYPNCEITNVMCLKDNTCNVFVRKSDASKGVRMHSSEIVDGDDHAN